MRRVPGPALKCMLSYKSPPRLRLSQLLLCPFLFPDRRFRFLSAWAVPLGSLAGLLTTALALEPSWADIALLSRGRRSRGSPTSTAGRGYTFTSGSLPPLVPHVPDPRNAIHARTSSHAAYEHVAHMAVSRRAHEAVLHWTVIGAFDSYRQGSRDVRHEDRQMERTTLFLTHRAKDTEFHCKDLVQALGTEHGTRPFVPVVCASSRLGPVSEVSN